jgi:hypothetical protein
VEFKPTQAFSLHINSHKVNVYSLSIVPQAIMSGLPPGIDLTANKQGEVIGEYLQNTSKDLNTHALQAPQQ